MIRITLESEKPMSWRDAWTLVAIVVLPWVVIVAGVVAIVRVACWDWSL